MRHRLSERAALGSDGSFFPPGATSALAEETACGGTFGLSARRMS